MAQLGVVVGSELGMALLAQQIHEAGAAFTKCGAWVLFTPQQQNGQGSAEFA